MQSKSVALTIAMLFAADISLARAEESLNAHWSCRDVGPPPALESIGDRENHAVQVSMYSCIAENGPLKGMLATGSDVVEWDGPVANIISGQGVARMPGTTIVWKNAGGKITLDMADGKVVGCHAEGKNSHPFATGAAAKLTGTTTAWTTKCVGPGLFVVDDQ